MDFLENPTEFMAMTSALLLLLLSTNMALQELQNDDTEHDHNNDFDRLQLETGEGPMDTDIMNNAPLHSFQLLTSVHVLGEDLGYWVKPRSTTWFSQFLLEQYAEDRWLQLFRMMKQSVFSLAELLKPSIAKKDTKYRHAIPVLIRVVCTLFKLSHGASLLVCSKMFAMGRSSVSMILRDVVHAINETLRGEINWPQGEALQQVEADFRQLSCLPSIVGAIDGTHIAISKPRFAPADYYYFKSGGYTLNCQAVVASDTRFLDLFLGMPGSTNDARVLRRSSLYQKGNAGTLWDAGVAFEGFSPYLLGDAGYPLLPWLMVPHHDHDSLGLANSVFNQRLRRGRGVVENAFAMLKQTFRELLTKTELDVTFVPDVIVACAILHNVLQRQSGQDVARLLHVLSTEAENAPPKTSAVAEMGMPQPVADGSLSAQETAKRQDLGIYLALQRRIHTQ